jgi:hypothetical protein
MGTQLDNATILALGAIIDQIIGLEATDAELNRNHDVVPGTTLASHTLVVDANKRLDTLDITALEIGNVAVTATAAEINWLASVTPGTVTASKALVVDAASALDALDIGTLSLATVAVTASAAEINVLDAVTPGTVTASKALVCGASSDLDELTITTLNMTAVKDAGDHQVVGAQQALITSAKVDYAAGDLDAEAEIIIAINATNTTINSILAALRTHGLIAT